ncbi:MAG: stalk domain-containing protein [Bacillota bacterium]|nr:stalk domain-containing protein [Bacillota bacterium]MDW7677273.1 stalk domain-containing protein [Bacillota bacterium]
MNRKHTNRKWAYIINCLFLIAALAGMTLHASAGSGISGTEVAVKMHINSARAYVNQDSYVLEQPPVISNGRTLVPLRFFSEALGARVLWNDAEKSILFQNSDKRVRLYVNQKTAYVNDRSIQMDVPPTIVNGRTLVPVRFISEVLGFKVKWDEKTQAVIITGITSGGMDLAAVESDREAFTPVTRGVSRTTASPIDFELEVIRLVNIEREKAKLPPVSKCDHLMEVADAKSQDMVDKRYFAHTSPTYGDLSDMLGTFQIDYGTSGENIAAGQMTPEEVMEGWMNSPGHRNNILHPDFNLMGVGTVEGGLYGGYTWTQLFTD